MRIPAKIAFASLALLLSAASAQAAEQSSKPADQAMQQKVSSALIQAGIDPRRTSVQVVTGADHVVYLSGLISDRNMIQRAGDAAAKAAPGWRVVNAIHSSFFDDPNHVTGNKTK